MPDDRLDLGQAGMIAIGGTAGRVNEPPDLCVARSDEHVHEAGYVGGVGRDRIRKATRHAAQRGLMQHIIDALACS